MVEPSRGVAESSFANHWKIALELINWQYDTNLPKNYSLKSMGQ